jgi:DNA-binding SARP family transcriptional activator
MQVRLLGPVDVLASGMPRTVSGLRRKAVLTVLALHAGRPVSSSQLIEQVWGAAAPATALNALQSHVSYLRGVLGNRSAIVARPPGYLLGLGDDATDALVVERLLAAASRAGDRTEAERHLQAALALWRGPALADLGDVEGLAGEAERLDGLRLRTRRALLEARLALGRHADLVPELEQLAREHPLDEQLHGQLMLAQYRSGRQADALATFRRVRGILLEDLGLEPSRELRELEAAILRQDRALTLVAQPVTSWATEAGAPAPEPAVSAPPARGSVPAQSVVPAQLPLAPPRFVGRLPELAQLDAMLPGPQRADATLAVLSGPPGVGKTSLALHWAHRAGHRFPHGRLYVNLRGFDPHQPPMDSTIVMRRFLAAFRVASAEMPAEADALATYYRSVLAGRQVLIVLDNALDADQVRPLLPGVAGCAVIVTGRVELIPLVANEGALPLRLDALTDEEARDLLRERLGADRVAREPAASAAIISRCGHLPLALVVAAAHTRTRPAASLSAVAEQLSATGPLDALDGGDLTSNVRAVFSWSYRALDDQTARLFRLLALHPGPSSSSPAVASLAGCSLSAVRPLVRSLLRANLLTESTPGRYAVHDLLRDYAAELAERHDPVSERRDAVERLLEHYARTATAAVTLLDAGRSAAAADPAPPGVTVQLPTDPGAARAWFAAEDGALQAAIHAAVDPVPETGTGIDGGTDRKAWQLASAMTTYLDWAGQWHDLLTTQLAVLPALERLQEFPALADAHREIGRTCAQLGRIDEAATYLGRAVELYRDLDDPAGQGRAHHSIGWMHQAQGDYRRSLDHAEQALALFRDAGDRLWEARELNATGWLHLQLHEPAPALDRCRRALVLLRRLQDRHGEASTLDTMGLAQHQMSDDHRAVEYYLQALEIYTELGDAYSRALVRLNLGDSLAALGRNHNALESWRQALAGLRSLDEAGTSQLRLRLTDRCSQLEVIADRPDIP